MVARGSFFDVEYSAANEHSQGIADESEKETIGLTSEQGCESLTASDHNLMSKAG